MDHREFLSNLDAAMKADLTQRSDLRGLVHLAGHMVFLLTAGSYVAVGGPLWQIVVFPYGVALIFLFTLEHETTHKTPFASLWINEGVGRICGVVLVLPFEWFRFFHLAHHKHTNDPKNDPELEGPRPDTRFATLVHITGIPYWVWMVKTVVKNAAGAGHAPWIPERAKSRIVWEARVLVGIYSLGIMSLSFSNILFWIWILPCLIGQPFLRIYLLAEHGRCPPVENMFENTRTTFTTAIVRFFAWNMPYHSEHHAYPNVPFWRLPELHVLAAEHLKETSNGYVRFAKDYATKL